MGALPTQGITIKVSDGASPRTLIQINGMDNMSGPNSSRDEIDVTHFNSSAKEFLQGLVDNGSIEFSGVVIPGDSGQQEIETLFGSNALREFEITLPTDTDAGHSTGTKIEFSARVQTHQFNAQKESRVEVSWTARLSGAKTITWGS